MLANIFLPRPGRLAAGGRGRASERSLAFGTFVCVCVCVCVFVRLCLRVPHGGAEGALMISSPRDYGRALSPPREASGTASAAAVAACVCGSSVRGVRACVRSRTPIRVGRRDVRTPSNGAAARDVSLAMTSIIILAGAPEATLVAAAGRVALHSVCHTRAVRSAVLFL